MTAARIKVEVVMNIARFVPPESIVTLVQNALLAYDIRALSEDDPLYGLVLDAEVQRVWGSQAPMVDIRDRGLKCAWCSMVLESAEPDPGNPEGQNMPAPGDPLVCGVCAGLSLMVGSSDTRRPSHEEMEGLWANERVRATIESVQAEIRERA